MKRITAALTAFAAAFSMLPMLPVENANAYDAEFERLLTAEHFPESYKPALRELHEKHPAWVFKSIETGLEWHDVLDNQTILGKSLVHTSSPDSWKSMKKGAYDFETGTWYGLDGDKWVQASDETVAYNLDPRNFLDDDNVFMFERLSYDPDVHKADGVTAIVKGTFMAGDYTCPDTGEVKNYTETFMEAAQISGVSPYHLATSVRLEQGVNGSPQSLGTAKGFENYFNFLDIQAYATATLTAGQQGARWAMRTDERYLLPWTNQYRAIVGGAIYIAQGYISKGQDTYYLEKFDVIDGGDGYYNHQYMTCVTGAASLASMIRRAYSDEVYEQAHEFRIPIYNNMPEKACPEPGVTVSDNALLASLTLPGYSYSPNFSPYVTEYKLEVDSSVDKLTVWAKAADANAKAVGYGTWKLQYGENKVEVVVTAESGEKRTYTVTVTRPEPKAVKGDVNNDGIVDVVDALTILNYSAGKQSLSSDAVKAGDIDGNGYADVIDALTILSYVSGKTKTL